MEKLSIYIHIPFCESKCHYCDFNSYKEKDEGVIRDYIDALLKEISLYKEDLGERELYSIFIGGGTPSSIDSKYIVEILDHIRDNFNTKGLEEISMEANPGSLNAKEVLNYKKAGINRISLGLQSTDNEILRKIGRLHTYEDFLNSYKLLRESGFDNINIDLMFALPEQTLEDVYQDLERITNLDPEHISYYSLILEEGTRMYEDAESKKYSFPSDVEDRKMYHTIVETLKDKGYGQYEISNFAQPGFTCKHNMVYWKIEPYLGLGVSSHSNIDQERFANREDIASYIKELDNSRLAIDYREEIDKDTEITEYCLMGIRLEAGIDKQDFKRRFSKELGDIYGEIIAKHVEDGLLIEDEGAVYLTDRGKDLANLVEIDFL